MLLWDVRTAPAPVGQIEISHANGDPLGMIMSVSITDSNLGGPLVVSGYEDGSVAVSDVRTLSALQVLSRQHSEPVFALSTTPKSMNYIYSGGGDAKLIRYRLIRDDEESSSARWTEAENLTLPQNGKNEATHSSIMTRSYCCAGTSAIALRSDERIIASSHWDGTVRLFDRKKMKCLGIFRHHRESVLGVRFGKKGSEEATVFASCSRDGHIALWNLFADTYIND